MLCYNFNTFSSVSRNRPSLFPLLIENPSRLPERILDCFVLFIHILYQTHQNDFIKADQLTIQLFFALNNPNNNISIRVIQIILHQNLYSPPIKSRIHPSIQALSYIYSFQMTLRSIHSAKTLQHHLNENSAILKYSNAADLSLLFWKFRQSGLYRIFNIVCYSLNQ